MRSQFITCLDREIHYAEWGEATSDVIMCWHGLARTGRDFDRLAAALGDRYRLICPDVLGRGLSQWSPRPDDEYALDFYVELAAALVAGLGIGSFAWVGTSMGGAIGIRAAAGKLSRRIDRLVLNDIGPKLQAEAVARIRDYVGNPPEFDTICDLEDYFRQIYQPFGALSAAEWRVMAETSARRNDAGKITVHYDPNIARQFVGHPNDYDQWSEFEAIDCPTLLLRGESSDLLSAEVADDMAARGRKCRLTVVPGCGHAPPLNTPAQIALIDDFLRA